MSLKQNGDGKIKGLTVASENKQSDYIPKAESSSSTVAI